MPVVAVDSRSEETPRKVEKGDGQLAPLEAISSLVTQLLRTVQESRRMDEKPLPEESPLSAVSPGPGMEIGHPVKEWARLCFSCGRQGHGVNCRFSTETFWRLVFSHEWFRIHIQRDEVELEMNSEPRV